jgi:predicted CXXCH cytochrome family protein
MFLRREGSQLCVLCHEKMADSLHADHDPAGFASSLCEALGVQAAAGTCRTCHTAHSAQGPHLWARAPADTPADPNSNLCLTCHDGNRIKNPPGTYHPLAVSDFKFQISDSGFEQSAAAGPQSPIMSLRAKRGNRSPQSREVSCASCHDPHAGAQTAAQLRNAPESLCLTCHQEKQGIKGSVHDPNAAAWGKASGRTARGLCLDCHPIHAAKEQAGVWSLLGRPGTAGDLCEACHGLAGPAPMVVTPHLGKTLVQDPQEPVAPLVMHADKQIRCVTCHDIHRNEPDSKLLRAARGNSDLCLACHAELGPLLGTPHDLRRSAPEAHNVSNETATVSGPCGSCHLVHPPSATGETWAQPLPPGDHAGRGLCTGCHAPGQCAQGRVPQYVDHPEVALWNRTVRGVPGYMPTFDEHGRPSPTGEISCPTCHQVHASGSTSATEGESFSRMFLRPASQSLCVDCHGIEALWRFLYYHRANRNPSGKN